MAEIEDVWRRLDAEEIAELALTLSRIPSTTTAEGPVADYLSEWLGAAGFDVRRVSLVPERPNLLAVLPGQGGGKSLLFNSHMDIFWVPDDPRLRDPSLPIYRTAWREGDVLFGAGLVNDKAPMAAWLVAAKAIREAGIALRGDMVLTMVSGEIGHEPVDEFQGLGYSGKDMGARYLATHGGVADYVLVAEATDFRLGWVEAGKAFCKLRLFGGPSLYTPFVPDGEGPSAILRLSQLLAAWPEWATEYARRHRYECAGGVVVPRASIGAVRSGLPYAVTRTPEVCDLYVDLRTAPGQSPTATVQELRDFIHSLGLDGEVSLFLFRPGHEGRGVEPLCEAIRSAHRSVFGTSPELPTVPSTSMWRDINPWNEIGVPSAMYGPGAGSGGGAYSVRIDDLHKSSMVYAATALNVCG